MFNRILIVNIATHDRVFYLNTLLEIINDSFAEVFLSLTEAYVLYKLGFLVIQ